MNRIKLYTIWAVMLAFITACTPETYKIGNYEVSPADLTEGKAFTITHDASNPNIVYLESKMDTRYQPSWIHPQGLSQKKKVELHIPFAGTYEVTFGVETPAGIVYGEPVTFTCDQMCADFISDEAWSMLAGGAGKSKTWYLDLDKDGLSRHFLGPMYWFTAGYTWDNLHDASGKNYLDNDDWDPANAIVPNLTDGSATWYWTADWAGNSWMCDAADFGTMTFDLIGNANFSMDQEAYGQGKGKGTYMLDTETHQLKFTGANPLIPNTRTSELTQLVGGTFNILYLSENFMQLMIPATGTCLNYISEDYKKQYDANPPQKEDPKPPYNGNPNEDITTNTTTTKTWQLNLKNPYNWTDLSGKMLNEWTEKNGLPQFTTWENPYNKDVMSKVAIKFSKTGNNSGSYEVVDYKGESIMGEYSIDADNYIDFGKDITFLKIDWLEIATLDHKMRIISADKDATGQISTLWIGSIDPGNAQQYKVLGLTEKKSSGSTEEDPKDIYINALAGKTFTQDPNWFVDWVNFDMSGGWTSSSTFGEDYTSNSWVWDANAAKVAKSSSLSFTKKNGELYVTFTQETADGRTIINEGQVIVNPDAPSLKFSFPLVDYTGTAAEWVGSNNPKGTYWTTPLSENEWIYNNHGGGSLSTLSTNGFWLGKVSNAVNGGDAKDEVLLFHWVIK